jgi:uncharacterized RDD family membrane protein YckC
MKPSVAAEQIIDEPVKAKEREIESSISEYPYAGVSDRIKAIICDAVMIGIFMFIIAKIFASIGPVSDTARMLSFVFVFCLYDPLFTSIFGGTIGHFMNGLRVKRENDFNRNILFPLGLVRFAIKACLGWLSMITVGGNDKSKAIHDIVAGSVVIYKKK